MFNKISVFCLSLVLCQLAHATNFSSVFNETTMSGEMINQYDPNWEATVTVVDPPFEFWDLDYGGYPFLTVGTIAIYPSVYQDAWAVYQTGLTGDTQSSSVTLYYKMCANALPVPECISTFGPTVENKYVYSPTWQQYGWEFYSLVVTQTGWSVHKQFVSNFGCYYGGGGPIPCNDTVLYTYSGSFASKANDTYTLIDIYNQYTDVYTFSVKIIQNGTTTTYSNIATDTNTVHNGVPGMGGVIGGEWYDDGGIYYNQAISVLEWNGTQSN